MSDITFTTTKPPTPNQLQELFTSSGIRRPTNDEPRLRRMIDHANLIVTAWSGDTLVGIARALTDFSYCCYVSDLAVAKPFQRQGIGRKLLEIVHDEVGDEVTILLVAAPEAEHYYPKLHFERIESAWRIARKR